MKNMRNLHGFCVGFGVLVRTVQKFVLIPMKHQEIDDLDNAVDSNECKKKIINCLLPLEDWR